MGNEQSSERPMINASTRTGKSFGDFQAVPKPTEATQGKVVCEVRAAAVRREEKFITASQRETPRGKYTSFSSS